MDVYTLEITHSLYLSMYLRNRQIWQKVLLLRKVPCHQAGIYGERSLKKRLNPDSINNFSSLWNGKRFSPWIKKTELTQKARLCAPVSSTHVRPFTLSRKILVLWLIFRFQHRFNRHLAFVVAAGLAMKLFLHTDFVIIVLSNRRVLM